MKSPRYRSVARRVDAFLLAEALSDAPGYAKTQERLLQDGGVFDLDPEEIVQMRIAVIKYNNRERQKNSG
jgi:hypothetical protein